ncbi:MAG: hypothetical protein R8G34_11955 [Paracoccaceae bacterium]|nr:hypothetical protein [Paracoccaceae bacterium]
MLERLQNKTRKTAQRIALNSFGALMVLAGIGFLSASALLLLLTLTDAITAFAIMGGAFLGVGLLVVYSAKPTNPNLETDRLEATQEPMPPIAAAFMQGMTQGMAARRYN